MSGRPVTSIPALAQDDRVAVIAPASAPVDSADLNDGLARLREAGLSISTFYDLNNRRGYLADSDEERLRHLNTVIESPEIRAILCVRGGYGMTRILDHVDFAALQENPKIIVGYSDITALHLGVLAQTGLPGLSAAMVATDWKNIDPAEAKAIVACLEGHARAGLFSPSGLSLQPEKTGTTEGRLVGGNLSVLCRLIGSPYLPDLTGAILFVEDVGEPPYRIDALFSQLKLTGILARIGALVIGEFTEADPPSGRPSLGLDEVVQHYASLIEGPVASGLNYGHFQPKEPMPIGIRARLEVSPGKAELRALEQLVK